MKRFLSLVLVAFALPCLAAKTTICTVTVNSADERDAFRRYLPEDQYEFVELLERGRPDWLSSACRRGVHCDVLVVSGHFAGTEFYSSRFDAGETLPVDEIERVQCSDACPGLFAELKEVYLFGCDTLKPEPVKSASPHIVRDLVRSGVARGDAEAFARGLSERYGESSRGLMRRLFANVPVIYGFSSLAPYGRVAGPMLARHLESSADEVGSGRPSGRLLSLFGPSSMTWTQGMQVSEVNSDYRAESCRFFDDRDSLGLKVANVGRILAGPTPQMRMSFDRVEKFLGAIDAAEGALRPLRADSIASAHFLEALRETEDPALRTRMIALARRLHWLDPGAHNAELVRLVHDVLATPSMGFGEVDLICTLNKDGELDKALRTLESARVAQTPAQAAALACLGSSAGRERVLRALASADEREVQIAQAFLRHRPLTDPAQLKDVVLDVSRIASEPAQVRAIETLARQHIADRDVLDSLLALYVKTRSVNVQRAVAEVFLRSGVEAADRARIAALIRENRRRAGGVDTIDALLEQLRRTS